jgi:hypothetical protein
MERTPYAQEIWRFHCGLCVLALSVYLFIPLAARLWEGKDFGAGFLPKLIGVGMFVCGAILAVRGSRTMRTVEVEASPYKSIMPALLAFLF